MSAARAELIRRANRTETGSAACGELVIALRAEMKIALHERAARGAARYQRLAQQEVEHRAYAARHNEADQHPEARAHGPPRSVLADIPDHQQVQRPEKAPRQVEIDT